MQIILERIDGAIYGDLILSSKEIEEMSMGEMINGEACFGRKKIYLGVRLRGYNEESEESDQNSDET
jgi:hypothetical protein